MATVKTSRRKPKTEVRQAEPTPLLLPRVQRLAVGKALRDTVPRASQAEWKPSAKHRDPIDILEASNKDRVPELPSPSCAARRG